MLITKYFFKEQLKRKVVIDGKKYFYTISIDIDGGTYFYTCVFFVGDEYKRFSVLIDRYFDLIEMENSFVDNFKKWIRGRLKQ